MNRTLEKETSFNLKGFLAQNFPLVINHASKKVFVVESEGNQNRFANILADEGFSPQKVLVMKKSLVPNDILTTLYSTNSAKFDLIVAEIDLHGQTNISQQILQIQLSKIVESLASDGRLVFTSVYGDDQDANIIRFKFVLNYLRQIGYIIDSKNFSVRNRAVIVQSLSW